MTDERLEFLGKISDVERTRYTEILQNTRIRIIASEAISARRDVEIAARRGADILRRLFDDVRIEIEAPWLGAADVPDTHRLGISEGGRIVTVALGDMPGDIHVGYQRGELLVAEIERLPCEAADPAALLAGPAIAAEVFKFCFEPHIREIVRRDYALPIGLTKDARRLIEGDIPLSLLIAGGGSVGFALVDALTNLDLRLTGQIDIVDNGTLEERNFWKYASLDLSTARSNARKIDILRARLVAAYPQVAVELHDGSIQSYDGRSEEIAVVSMDNVAARRSAQENLSRDVVNIAVQGTYLEVASLTFGHTGCLYCYYRDNPEEAQSSQAIAERVGLTIDRIEHLMANNEPLSLDDLQTCASYLGVPLESLRLFLGQPLRSMIARLYAQAKVRAAAGSVNITTAFVSAMAGSLGVFELLKAARPEFRADRRSIAIDMLGVFHDLSLREIAKRPDCAVCNGKHRLAEYAKLWRVHFVHV